MDKNALSYWFPLIETAGLPVPRTKIVKMPREAQGVIWKAFDGKDGGDGAEPFFAELTAVAHEMGFPCFLRTDHTSGKHEWERTCYLRSAGDIPQHVFNLAEHSELVDIMGLPWDTWAVREFLPTMPLGVCPRYHNMPICREFRFFVDNEQIRCWHGYWPMGALEQGGADISLFDDKLWQCDAPEVPLIAAKAGRAVGGSWSVDILETRNGWMVTDMALASDSFHWEGCPMAKQTLDQADAE